MLVTIIACYFVGYVAFLYGRRGTLGFNGLPTRPLKSDMTAALLYPVDAALWLILSALDWADSGTR